MDEIGSIGFGINTATREKCVGGKLLAGWEERVKGGFQVAGQVYSL